MTDPRRPDLPGGLSCDEVRDLAAGFVLDGLEPAEMAAVREHLADCQEPHPEMAELGGVVPVLQAAVPVVEPPASLKARIMAAAVADLEARRAAEAPVVEAPSPVTEAAAGADIAQPSAEVIRPFERRRPSMRAWALGIAAVLAIVALGGWNLRLQQQLNDAQAYQGQVAGVIDAAQQPGALTAVLRATAPGDPGGFAAVTSDGSVKLAMRDLAPTSGTEVYEAWVIPADGVPKALGELALREGGVGYLEAGGLPTENGMILAITREPRPGATAPSSNPISAGKASTV
jgi:Anti-sigma-K factor rskA/Putative zinc-finger